MSLKQWLSDEDIEKLKIINNPKVEWIIEEFLTLCKPDKAKVFSDTDEDMEVLRKLALENKEELKLKMERHTIHFDSYYDQARDKENTRILIPSSEKDRYGTHLNVIDREEGLKEIFGIMDGIMKGKTALICFFCLGPTNSKFSIPALQITDSAYVAHSEDILYRRGYKEFVRLNGSEDFFYFIHSAGELKDVKIKNKESNKEECIARVTKNKEKRRIYIDLKENRVFSVNNQYAGNSLGLKKLALRLAINKAVKEGWLAEHMFISAVHNKKKKRKSYFLGAFPSACGKTSTAMLPGNTIIGDDIAYLRVNDQGEIRAVNIERGIFGIIKDVNPTDDPFIYKALTTPREVIFSNVLISDGKPYWLGMGTKDIPERGINWIVSEYGEWHKGLKDKDGKEIPYAHPNARYTLKLEELENVDDALNDPNGVPVAAIIYGGRDSDTSVPIYESFNWEHGVFLGATLESETTAATLGKEGIRKPQPMANLDFIVVPLADYFNAHLKIINKVRKDKIPKIFATNYFLKDENGEYYDEKIDKIVWIRWAEGRLHGDYEAIETPIGYIPKYETLKELFKEILNKEYEKERYEKEFAIRVTKYLEKMDRIEKKFREIEGLPSKLREILREQKSRLIEAKKRYKGDVIPPSEFET